MLAKRFYYMIIVALFLLSPAFLAAQKYWDGEAGDQRWDNPVNWADDLLPLSTDSVVLDNRYLPENYRVVLSDTTVTIASLRIEPGLSARIELLLPASNLQIPALQVNGQGGIRLLANAVITNHSGGSPGTSLLIADSLYLCNGSRYIHQCSSGHAAIVARLSRAPGTENGVFEFDVTGTASYTISLANRVYGTLCIRAAAAGGQRNYLSTGTNPALVRGDLEIATGVNYRLDLAGELRIKKAMRLAGQLYLSPGAQSARVLLEAALDGPGQLLSTGTGNPVLEFAGTVEQSIRMDSVIQSGLTIRMNNPSGIRLEDTLRLACNLELVQGVIYSRPGAHLCIESNGWIIADSLNPATYVEGPVQLEAEIPRNYFYCPLGQQGQQRWLSLSNMEGVFLLEYKKDNPHSLATLLDTGLHHISQLEYWKIKTSPGAHALISLSFNNAHSGGVTALEHLRVAQLNAQRWMNAGNTAVTGSPGSNGTVRSLALNWPDGAETCLTLASTTEGNPLPVQAVRLLLLQNATAPVLGWLSSGLLPGGSIEIQFAGITGFFTTIAVVRTPAGQTSFQWKLPENWTEKAGYFRIRQQLENGNELISNRVFWQRPRAMQAQIRRNANRLELEIYLPEPAIISLRLIDGMGRLVRIVPPRQVGAGRQLLPIGINGLAPGIYRLFGVSSTFLTNPISFFLP